MGIHGLWWVKDIIGYDGSKISWVKGNTRQARGSSSKASCRVSRPQFGSAGSQVHFLFRHQKQPHNSFKITTVARHSSNWMTVNMLINTALGILCVSHDGYAFIVPFGMVCVGGGCVTWPSWRCRRVIWIRSWTVCILEWFWPFPVFVN